MAKDVPASACPEPDLKAEEELWRTCHVCYHRRRYADGSCRNCMQVVNVAHGDAAPRAGQNRGQIDRPGLTESEIAELRALAAENAPLLMAWKGKVLGTKNLSCTRFFDGLIREAADYPGSAGALALKRVILESRLHQQLVPQVEILRRNPASRSAQNARPSRQRGIAWWLIGLVAALALPILGGNTGGVILIMGVAVAVVGFTIWAAMDAFKRGMTGWGVGILLSWAVGFGWLAAIIYRANRPSISGVVDVATPQVGSTLSRTDPVWAIEKIRELASLHEEGILTDAEFAVKKAELLSRI